jgi:hypothetical protein
MTPAHSALKIFGAALSLVLATDSIAQQILWRGNCMTNFQGVQIRGVAQVERWISQDTHRIYGRFLHPNGTLIEFEVMTNQPGGVGGMWFNHARHREIRINLHMTGNGFAISDESGRAAQYLCR